MLHNDGSWNAYTPKHNLIWKALPLQENHNIIQHMIQTYWLLSSFIMELLWNKIIIYMARTVCWVIQIQFSDARVSEYAVM